MRGREQILFRSDTEVVLCAFEKWGIEAPKRFVGIFAFVVLDLRNKMTYVVRDHLGIKPLYLMRQNNILYFASEIKAFRPLQNSNLTSTLYLNNYHLAMFLERIPYLKALKNLSQEQF